jgi:hypothetical protein
MMCGPSRKTRLAAHRNLYLAAEVYPNIAVLRILGVARIPGSQRAGMHLIKK